MPDECQFSSIFRSPILRPKTRRVVHRFGGQSKSWRHEGYRYNQRRSMFQWNQTKLHHYASLIAMAHNKQPTKIHCWHLLPSQQCYPQLSEMPYRLSPAAHGQAAGVGRGITQDTIWLLSSDFKSLFWRRICSEDIRGVVWNLAGSKEMNPLFHRPISKIPMSMSQSPLAPWHRWYDTQELARCEIAVPTGMRMSQC